MSQKQTITDYAREEKNWHKVESSNIDAIAMVDYDATSPSTGDGILLVKFKGSVNAFYTYHGISWETFSDFLSAESKGKFFASEIKDKYDCLKYII